MKPPSFGFGGANGAHCMERTFAQDSAVTCQKLTARKTRCTRVATHQAGNAAMCSSHYNKWVDAKLGR